MRNLALFALTALIAGLPTLALSCGEPEWPAGCPHGDTWLPNIEDPDTPGAYFDFSEGELVYGEEGRQRGDIYLDLTFVAGNPALEVAVHDAQPDSLLYDRTAPSWGSQHWKESPDGNTPGRVSIYDGHNIWIRTAEGHTAKLRLLAVESNDDYTSYLRIKFRWIYQPDGSTEFRDVVEATDSETEGA